MTIEEQKIRTTIVLTRYFFHKILDKPDLLLEYSKLVEIYALTPKVMQNIIFKSIVEYLFETGDADREIERILKDRQVFRS